jgi:hypothetical protein
MPDALGADPVSTRATGYVSWANVYSWWDDKPVDPSASNSYVGGSQGVIKVRLRRERDEWVDDGTTFRSNNQEMHGPLLDPWCSRINDRSWGFGAGRLDALSSNWIVLRLDLAAGTAYFGAAVGATGLPSHGISRNWSLVGDCWGRPGDRSEIIPVGGGGAPGCPKDAGVEGTMDASRTRIVFSCHHAEQGVPENHARRYEWRTRVNGRITLSP